MFRLHLRLGADTAEVGDLALCRVLLMRDARYPWLILVPMREGARELHDLTASDRTQLMEEIALSSRALTGLFSPDKINTGAIGNIVPQLHVHVVARMKGDPAWPGPVWGHSKSEPYELRIQERMCARIGRALGVANPVRS